MGSPANTITIMGLYSELRRRNVIKVALVYVITAWLLVRGAMHFLPLFGFPVWADEFVTLLLLVGFPLALWFAWIYEITPAGLKKTIDVDQTQSIVYRTGQKLNAALAVLLVLVLVSLVLSRLFPPPPEQPKEAEPPRFGIGLIEPARPSLPAIRKR